MDAQVCEYTINHWIMHFKKVNCVECEFDLSKDVFFFFLMGVQGLPTHLMGHHEAQRRM